MNIIVIASLKAIVIVRSLKAFAMTIGSHDNNVRHNISLSMRSGAIKSGLHRKPRFDPNRELKRLMMANENQNWRLPFAHYIYSNSQRLINLADTKAGACFAVSGLILPFVLEKMGEVKNVLNESGPFQKFLILLLLSSCLLSLSLCLLTAFSAFSPRVLLKKKQGKGHIFFSDINLYQGNNALFYENFKKLSEQELLEDYSTQIFILSNILQRKYLMVRRAILLTGISLVCCFLLFSFLSFIVQEP
ncbi:MAG: Pycsar system effector family protein [Planctomycetota bacterium]